MLMGLVLMDKELARRLNPRPAPKQQMLLTLDQLDRLAIYLGAEANHITDTARRKKLNRLAGKIDRLLAALEAD